MVCNMKQGMDDVPVSFLLPLLLLLMFSKSKTLFPLLYLTPSSSFVPFPSSSPPSFALLPLPLVAAAISPSSLLSSYSLFLIKCQ